MTKRRKRPSCDEGGERGHDVTKEEKEAIM